MTALVFFSSGSLAPLLKKMSILPSSVVIQNSDTAAHRLLEVLSGGMESRYG